jgi:hypothetical protein
MYGGNMFTEKTVLVVGAGASFDFGFPLGPMLLDNIVRGIETQREKVRGQAFLSPYLPNSDKFIPERYRSLYLLAATNKVRYIPYRHTQFDEFVDTAKAQTITSIDRFLRDHPEHAEVGKYLIALEMHCSCYTDKDYEGRPILPDFSKPQNTRWVGKLVNHIREGALDSGDLKKNRLTIITFNYDDTLERVFDAQLANTSRHRGANWREFIEIVHVYGQIVKPGARLKPEALLEEVAQSAKTIGYIHDGHSDEAFLSKIEGCRAKLLEAERVVCLGFAFDAANVELLGHNKKN